MLIGRGLRLHPLRMQTQERSKEPSESKTACAVVSFVRLTPVLPVCQLWGAS